MAWQTREILSPLVIAGLIAYFLNPIVNALTERTRIGHRFAVNSVYFVSLALFFAIPAVLIPVLSSDIETLSQDLLAIGYRIQTFSAQPVVIGNFVLNLPALIPQPEESVSVFIGAIPENILHIIESTSKNAVWFLVIIVSVYY